MSTIRVRYPDGSGEYEVEVCKCTENTVTYRLTVIPREVLGNRVINATDEALLRQVAIEIAVGLKEFPFP